MNVRREDDEVARDRPILRDNDSVPPRRRQNSRPLLIANILKNIVYATLIYAAILCVSFNVLWIFREEYHSIAVGPCNETSTGNIYGLCIREEKGSIIKLGEVIIVYIIRTEDTRTNKRN